MRSVVAVVLLVAACTMDDPNQLTGGPLVHHRTDGSKALLADDATTTSSGTTTTTSTISQQCFEIINKYRAKAGVPALQEWTSEETCAESQAKSDSQTNTAHGAFTKCGELAQNECPGYPDPASEQLPECLADMYAEGASGGHYKNMTSTKYTKVACAVYELSDGTFWSVQDFR